MMGCNIRPLKMEEYEKYSFFRWGDNPPTAEFEWVKAEIENGNRLIYIYETDGEFLGEGALVLKNDDPDYTIPGRRVYMSRVLVKKEYRNLGLGTKIVSYLIRVAEEKGFDEVSVGVDLDNFSARYLYEVKTGFNEVICEDEDEGGKYLKLLRRL